MLLLALFSTYFLSIEAVANESFPALLAFGDSMVDTGNNNYLLTLMKGNYWPYGWNFDKKIPTGRFGNGRVFSDIVAEGLGIKRIVPAYRKLYIAPSDLKTGVSFASGGAGVDPVTSEMLRVLSPAAQVKDFKGYLRKLKGIVGKKKAKEIVANSVILVSEGNNDIGITYAIHDAGARKFAVMGVIPLGCLPMSRLIFGRFFVWCNFLANTISEDYNKKLKSGIKSWRGESDFRGARFVYVDMYNSLMDVINNHRKYGFTHEKNGCCFLDTGNNNFLLTLLKGNYWPYGLSFDYKFPTGRFGNGRVFTDIVAQGLQIKRLVPAYSKIRRIDSEDLKTGVCFASGGSGIDDLTSRTLRVLSAGDQVKDFKDYLKKLKRVVKRKKKVKEIVSNAVFLISEGNNDLGYFVAPALIRLQSTNTYTSKMVVWTRKFLKDLYDLGARKFAVMGVMPVGCLPLHRAVFGGVFGWCKVCLRRHVRYSYGSCQKS
ncbi:unnamed protein product [Arabidopsis arenosa]|uniref:Uncharacterized protein n=1 Tax=Arabidopsis arenosa TaxID=38785 RepID=A0A8S1ZS59_ARAAE|nr:unnamed protein product [Arabidopsis arenosa]